MRMPAFLPASLLALLLGLAMAACDRTGDEPRQVILASTTSTEDSGLFDVLLPAFEADNPAFRVVVIAAGTGESLELGRRGDADVLLVHAPAAESAFVAQGHGLRRDDVMYNDFVLVGPASDPAGVRDAGSAIDGMRRIATAGQVFVSRGDDSGTHQKEGQLWREAEQGPGGDGYVEAGLGMGDVLRVASERGGYTLTDRATFLFMRDALELEILLEGDPRLFNQYGVIPVANARNPDGARAFARWITSPDAQTLIGDYGTDRFGEPLFTPNAKIAGLTTSSGWSGTRPARPRWSTSDRRAAP